MQAPPDQRPSKWKADFLFLAFVLAFWAASLLPHMENPPLLVAAIMLVCGCVLFVIASPRPIAWPDLPAKIQRPRWQHGAVGLSVIVSATAFVIFWTGNSIPEQYTGLPLLLWAISIVIFWIGVSSFRPATATEKRKIPGVEISLLVLIILAAFFLRIHQIDVFPNGCQSDECNNGVDALAWLQGQPYTPYAGTNEGQATLFTYLLALSFNLLGSGVTQMRLVSAVIGTLTIVAFYFLARDWLKWPFALAATGLFAVARWHLTFSRIVYELIMTPLAEILVFLFLLRALKNGRTRDWAAAGLCLALGMNTYTGFRFIPILIVVYLVYWLMTHRNRIRRDLTGAFYLALGAWIGMVPLSVFILQNWETFMGRTAHISIANDIANAGNSLQPLWENISRTLWAFHWKGDWAALNNLPGEPHLDVIVGVLFLFGFAYALRNVRLPLSFLYVSWIIGGLGLAILSTVNESPTARRPIGLLPVIFLVAGTTLQLTWDSLRDICLPLLSARSKNAHRLLGWGEALFLGAVVLLVGAININTFFNVQARNPSVWRAYSATEAAIGEYLRDLPANDQVYMDAAFTYHSAINLISQARPYTVLNLAQHLPILDIPNPPRNTIYILAVFNRQLEPIMKRLYPQGAWAEHRDPFGETMFYTFSLSAKAMEQANGITGEYYPGHEISGEPVITRQDSALDFQWTDPASSPLPAPFSSRWSGSIYLPNGNGEYQFAIRTAGAAELLIDGESILKTSGTDQPIASAPFVGGFHTFTLTYHSGSNPAGVTLLWKDSNQNLVPVPRSAFFDGALGRNGLVGYYYPNGDMTGSPGLIQHDLFILPNSPLPEPFSTIWKGKIEIPQSGDYIFGTIADDGSYVYIDGQRVVDNGGSHGAESKQGTIRLNQGLHDVEIRYWQLGGSRELQFWWQPPGKVKENVPLEYLFPAESQASPQ